MKNKFLSVVLLLALSLCLLVSCGGAKTEEELWKSATYLEDTTLGNGSTTIYLNVNTGTRIITITVNTDKATLGEALIEHNVIEGENGPYGLYVTTVNGMFAKYEEDGMYWSLYVNGEYGLTGVDTTEIVSECVYELRRERG